MSYSVLLIENWKKIGSRIIAKSWYDMMRYNVGTVVQRCCISCYCSVCSWFLTFIFYAVKNMSKTILLYQLRMEWENNINKNPISTTLLENVGYTWYCCGKVFWFSSGFVKLLTAIDVNRTDSKKKYVSAFKLPQAWSRDLCRVMISVVSRLQDVLCLCCDNCALYLIQRLISYLCQRAVMFLSWFAGVWVIRHRLLVFFMKLLGVLRLGRRNNWTALNLSFDKALK